MIDTGHTIQHVSRPDDGITIAVHTYAPPDDVIPRGTVLLVHGGLHDPMHAQRFWQQPGVVAALVAAGYRVLAPDRRNTPADTRCDFALHSWQAEADDLHAVLTTLTPTAAHTQTRTHVIAASNGCTPALLLALALALRTPQRLASLLLGWPAAPHREPLASAFERTANAVEQSRTSADWLTHLQRNGAPRADSEHGGYAFGSALLHDPRLAASFAAHTPAAAATLIRASAAALLPGAPIRGLTPAACATLRRDLPVAILASLPDDHWHPPQTTAALHAALPHATLLPLSAPPPAPAFATSAATCMAAVMAWLAAADTHQATA